MSRLTDQTDAAARQDDEIGPAPAGFPLDAFDVRLEFFGDDLWGQRTVFQEMPHPLTDAHLRREIRRFTDLCPLEYRPVVTEFDIEAGW